MINIFCYFVIHKRKSMNYQIFSQDSNTKSFQSTLKVIIDHPYSYTNVQIIYPFTV